jgi:hypothetical protein
MVVFHTRDGDIEVRLVKLKGTESTDTEKVYLDEYCPIDEREDTIFQVKNTSFELRRYVIAQEVSYGVEIILRDGFHYGAYDGGLFVKITDMDSGADIYNHSVFKEIFERPHNTPSRKDESVTIKTIKRCVVGGEVVENGKLAFYSMEPGMTPTPWVV